MMTADLMIPRLRLVLAVMLSMSWGLAHASSLTPQDAIKVMVRAGYSGIAGVTTSERYYYAAAVNADRKRVRVAVDRNTGAIAAVTPLVRASSMVSGVPEKRSGRDAGRVVNQRPYKPLYPAYQRPPPPHAIGVRQYPFNAYGQPQKEICRYRFNAPGC